jgi:DNA-binding MarR family transcriptional regulator
MQKKGFVKLSKDVKIRNLVRITLTDEGKRVYQTTLKIASIHRIFKDITDNDCNKLESCLTKIRDAALRQIGDSNK